MGCMAPTEQLLGGAVLEAWQRLLRANCVFLRELDAEMRARHGMTVSDYDVLVQLRDAADGSLKMSELSRRTLLTRSGMTRLVQGLEQDGYVERRACDSDARVSYAVLTEAGHEHLAAARATHHAGIRRVFADHFTEDEAQQLTELLGRIPGVVGGTDSGCCGAPE
ncbi:MAG: transcriptional regulator, MarR family [Thermoleophilia bacterium]|nr:transcriptional regulator, MarR family [Thermoleophilia bacterium]